MKYFTKLAAHDLIFYENRSTPQIVSKGAAAKPKKGYGPQTARRAATSEEETKISKGGWLRVDQSGNKPNSAEYKKTKYRPQLVKEAVSKKALSLYKPLLQKKNSYGVDVPLRRTADSSNSLERMSPKKSTWSAAGDISQEKVLQNTTPTGINIEKSPNTIFSKIKNLVRPPHVRRTAVLAHEVGHLDNMMYAKITQLLKQSQLDR